MMTNNDTKLGLITVGPWKNWISISLYTDEYDGENFARLIALGWAIRLKLPKFIPRAHEYGISISKLGGEYDFMTLYFGLQTTDSRTTKSWNCEFPWAQWKWVGAKVLSLSGEVLYSGKIHGEIREASKLSTVDFLFKDYDGEWITANCHVEEWGWTRGCDWCSWLRFFYPPMVRKTLEMTFSSEVGREKGSWKGGTTGHSVEMLPGESPEQSFRRYCDKDHRSKTGTYKLTFIK